MSKSRSTFINISRSALPTISLLLAVTVHADDRETALETVVVTATRSETRLDDLPVSATILTSEDIRQSPAQSLDQLLLSVPGVNLSEPPSFAQHPTSNSVSIRGLGGYRTLVLLDGVPLNDAFMGYVQWNEVPLDAIERVEVLRGGASSLWGNYAMTGVINIVTKAPSKTGADLSASYGSYNTSQLGASGNVVATDWLKLNLRGDRYDTDGYNTTPEASRGPLDVPTTFRQNNLQGSALFSPGGGLSGYLRANYHDNRQTLLTPSDTNNQHDYRIAGGATQRFDNDSRIEWNGWYQHSKFQTFNTSVPTGGTIGYEEFVENVHTTPANDFGTSLQWIRNFEGPLTQAQVGADFRRISGEDVADIFDETGAQVRTDLGKGKQQFYGLFTQFGFKPFAIPLESTLSLRYDGFRNYDGYDGNPGGSGPQPNEQHNAFDPRFALRYQATQDLALRGAVYRAFRAPTLGDLYRGYSADGGTYLPNSQLGPETLFGGEVGADFKRGPFSAGATLFHTKVRDLIGSRNLDPSELPSGFFYGAKNINVGQVRSQGVELESAYVFSKTLRADITYTYTDSRVVENPQDPGSVDKQVPNIPHNTATAGLNWQPQTPWNIGLQTRWVDGDWGDSDSTYRQDPHFIADLYTDYRLTQAVQLFVTASNLFDRHYIGTNNPYGLPPELGPPLQVFGGVRVKL